jgi:hypothetical protein
VLEDDNEEIEDDDDDNFDDNDEEEVSEDVLEVVGVGEGEVDVEDGRLTVLVVVGGNGSTVARRLATCYRGGQRLEMKRMQRDAGLTGGRTGAGRGEREGSAEYLAALHHLSVKIHGEGGERSV